MPPIPQGFPTNSANHSGKQSIVDPDRFGDPRYQRQPPASASLFDHKQAPSSFPTLATPVNADPLRAMTESSGVIAEETLAEALSQVHITESTPSLAPVAPVQVMQSLS